MDILERSTPAPARHHSELLAGMYEDLRAPIDSVLGLAKLLADNDGNTLTSQQVGFAQMIYAAGTDMLSLVDDIVDLARIEARQPALDVAEQPFRELRAWLLRAFRHAARDRHVGFEIVLAPDLPAVLRTDGRRLRHLLRNLVSLAFRNTWGGQVTLAVAGGAGAATFELRRHGGEVVPGQYAAGAAIAICRELAHALGGEVRAATLHGEDLPVTLSLPLALAPAQSPRSLPQRNEAVAIPPAPLPVVAPAPWNRTRGDDEAVALIVEGNAQVAAVMLGLVRANGYQGAVASDVGTLRLLMRELAPEAVLIGGSLTDVDGWSALEMLRRDPQARRVPMAMSHFDGRGYVCVQTGTCAEWSAVAPARLTAALDAAAGRRVARLLAAGLPERERRGELGRCLEGRELLRAANGPAALAALRDESPDALMIGPALGGTGALELVRAVAVAAGPNFRDLPLVFLESRPGAPPILEIAMLRRRLKLADALDETALHLAQALGRGTTVRSGARRETASELAGRRALIVDDDIYNVYAMTGALEQQGMKVLLAESARDAVALLRDGPDIDAVLIDITMPGIDGDSAVHAMRAAHEGRLPIIAVTPRAMPGDREKCIGAGASDYVAKPVNVELLLALLRTWIARSR